MTVSDLPLLDCPFEVRRSPHERALQQRSLEWAPSHGMLADRAGQRFLRAARFGSLVAVVCPSSDPEALAVACDWLVWLFAFDDQYCEAAGAEAGLTSLTSSLARFLRVIAVHPSAPESSFERALADIWERTGRHATPLQWQRLRAAVDNYFFGQAWEVCHDATTVTLDEYQVMRPRTAGVPLWLMLVEILGGYRPDPDVMAAEPMTELLDLAAHVINWENDVRSYYKETRDNPDALNLVAILRREHGAKALDAAAALHRTAVAQYLAAERPLLANAATGLADYLAALRTVMSGFHDWFAGSGRYSGGSAATRPATADGR